MQKKELEIAAIKSRADDILKHHGHDSPGYKELKNQKRRLGLFDLMPPSSVLVCKISQGNKRCVATQS